MKKDISYLTIFFLGLITLTGCNNYPDQAKLDFQSDIPQHQISSAAKNVHLIPVDDVDLKEWLTQLKELEQGTLKEIRGHEITDETFKDVLSIAKKMTESPLGKRPAPNGEIGTVAQFLTLEGQLYLHDKTLNESINRHKAAIQSNQEILAQLKDVHERSSAATAKLNAILKPYDEKLAALKSEAISAQEAMNTALKQLNPLDFNVRDFNIKASWINFKVNNDTAPDCVSIIENRYKNYSRAGGILPLPAVKGADGKFYCSYMDSIGGGQNTQAHFVAALKSSGIDKAVINYVKASVILDVDTDYVTDQRKNAERAETDLKSQINLMSYSERRTWEQAQKRIESEQEYIKMLEDDNSDVNRQRIYRENLADSVQQLFTRYAIYLLAEDHELLTFDENGELQLTGSGQYVLINEIDPTRPTYTLIDANKFKEQEVMLIASAPRQYEKFKNFAQGLAGRLFEKG
ncbi:hypothetical protein ACFFLG_05975 [Shewanella indica]|uniref:hypothetical protein n=1 Tax=Shewanella indica TaxID=768528 RepID=UPI000C33EA43|nr:hypothetical protein [Shewanella indica]GHA97929.1 hypothetical protein GCM10007107_08750 [Shewanella indica]